MRKPFVWEEIEHWTLPDLCETLFLIEDQEQADSFMTAYAEVCDHAEHNIGYMADVLNKGETKEDAERICELFGVDFKIEPKQLFNNNSSCGMKTLDKTTTD